jgi:hypothetical protein
MSKIGNLIDIFWYGLLTIVSHILFAIYLFVFNILYLLIKQRLMTNTDKDYIMLGIAEPYYSFRKSFKNLLDK